MHERIHLKQTLQKTRNKNSLILSINDAKMIHYVSLASVKFNSVIRFVYGLDLEVEPGKSVSVV